MDKRFAYSFPDIYFDNISCSRGVHVKEVVFKRMFFGEEDESLSQISTQSKEGRSHGVSVKEKMIDPEKKAYAEGYADGERAGIESERQKLVSAVNDFKNALLELEKVKESICRDAEKGAVTLALAIGKKVVCREITADRDVVINVVSQAIKKVMDHENIRIRINPADMEIINNKANFSDLSFRNLRVSFIEDPDITCGGCVVETDSGDIEARIENQLEFVEEKFIEMIGQ